MDKSIFSSMLGKMMDEINHISYRYLGDPETPEDKKARNLAKSLIHGRLYMLWAPIAMPEVPLPKEPQYKDNRVGTWRFNLEVLSRSVALSNEHSVFCRFCEKETVFPLVEDGKWVYMEHTDDCFISQTVRMMEQMKDFAEHGVRADTTPTRMISFADIAAMESDRWWQEYFAKADTYVREAAKKVIPPETG